MNCYYFAVITNDQSSILCTIKKIGIYNSWLECQERVGGYKGNVYKLYKTFEEARRAWVFYEPRWNRTQNTSMPNLGEELNLPTLMEHKGDDGMY